jgi:sigma-B regulation protein RsbU (phosphoserine phosphatase)
VSGKGAAAAVVTSLARYTLRAAAVSDPDPVTVLDRLNTVLHSEYRGSDPRYCTVVHGHLERRDDGAAVTLATGGHPPALLIRADGSSRFLSAPGGQLVGAFAHARFTAVDVLLEPGDTLLLYTDGLTEARTHGRVRYSEEQLQTDLAGLAPATAPAVIGAVTDLLAGFGDGVEDDTALLALSIPGGDRA